eukprot:5253849-Alexandrium_andersonii.AAC.1
MGTQIATHGRRICGDVRAKLPHRSGRLWGQGLHIPVAPWRSAGPPTCARRETQDGLQKAT